MYLKPFTGPGSTPSRRRYWQEVADVVNASRKVPGRHVSVDEHEGKGSVISVSDTRRSGAGAGGGCIGGDMITATFSGIATSCGCVDLDAVIPTASMEYTANPFNSTFATISVASGTGWSFYDLFVVNGSFYQVDFTSSTCDALGAQDESGFDVNVACFDETNDQGVDPGQYVAIYAGPSFQALAFYSGVVMVGAALVSNILTCGDYFSDSFLDWNGGGRVGSAISGTASLVFA